MEGRNQEMRDELVTCQSLHIADSLGIMRSAQKVNAMSLSHLRVFLVVDWSGSDCGHHNKEYNTLVLANIWEYLISWDTPQRAWKQYARDVKNQLSHHSLSPAFPTGWQYLDRKG